MTREPEEKRESGRRGAEAAEKKLKMANAAVVAFFVGVLCLGAAVGTAVFTGVEWLTASLALFSALLILGAAEVYGRAVRTDFGGGSSNPL